MSDKNQTISINLIIRSKPLIVYKSLRALEECINHTIQEGFNLQISIYIKNSDAKVDKLIKQFCLTQKNHLGLAVRTSKSSNHKDILGLFGNARVDYILLCSDSGFFTKNFIVEAEQLIAQNKHNSSTYISQYTVNFDGIHNLVLNKSTTEHDASIESMYEGVYYDGNILIPFKLWEEISGNIKDLQDYTITAQRLAMEVVARGYAITTVPGTIYFNRAGKLEVVETDAKLSNKEPEQSTLLTPRVFGRMPLAMRHNPKDLSGSDTRNKKGSSFSRWKNAARQYPLLYDYAKTQYHIHKGLYNSARHNLTGRVIHKQQFKIIEDLTTVQSRVPRRLLDIGIDVDTIGLWGEINQYEPMIRASWDMMKYIPIVQTRHESLAARLYHYFCSNFVDNNIKDVVLVPHLIRGGADLAAINLIIELSKRNDVLVITTIDVDSPWLEKVKLRKNVICLQSKVEFVDIAEGARIDFILKVIKYWQVHRLSIINSELGYKIAQQHGGYLKALNCKVLLHTFAFDMTEDGYLFNYIPNGLVQAYPGVDMYVTDSYGYKLQLEEINGFEAEKVTPLYLPVASNVKRKTDYTLKRKVLWAGRIHTSKLIEVAVEIGKQLALSDIELHMYGAIDEAYSKDDKYIQMIKNVPNIIYHGSYDGFGSLDTNEYDIFLMTSRNEGMPNVILEAITANIFIIAPAVGGIPESITEEINGRLVADKFDPAAYVLAIKQTYYESSFQNVVQMRACNVKVVARHSIATYQRNLQKLMY